MTTKNPTILGPSTVRLFGWAISGIDVKSQGDKPPGYQGQSPLFGALGATDTIAYIMAFSYEGRYTPLDAPALFLVKTKGESVNEGKPLDLKRLGLAQIKGIIAFDPDLKFWAYDRSDQTVRLNICSGTLQQLVIDSDSGGTQARRIDLIGQESSFAAR
jgi:hypothetical protein